jgi:hypothetical protein
VTLDLPLHEVLLATGHHPLHAEVVGRHVGALATGRPLPPIEVERRPDGLFVLTDGRHRFAACLLAGVRTVPATVKG